MENKKPSGFIMTLIFVAMMTGNILPLAGPLLMGFLVSVAKEKFSSDSELSFRHKDAVKMIVLAEIAFFLCLSWFLGYAVDFFRTGTLIRIVAIGFVANLLAALLGYWLGTSATRSWIKQLAIRIGQFVRKLFGPDDSKSLSHGS